MSEEVCSSCGSERIHATVDHRQQTERIVCRDCGAVGEAKIAGADRNQAPDWRAALLILNAPLFERDGRVWNHVDLAGGNIYFTQMLEDGTFSSGERGLLEIAASLFSTDVQINLWRVLGKLDEENTTLALRAIAAYCGQES